MPYGENMWVRKLHPGMSYSAVGCKFDVNKSTMNLFKQK